MEQSSGSPNKSIRSSAAKGVLLVMVLKAIGVSIGRTSQLILPFFLTPTDFGIFALAAVLFGSLALLADFGMSAALVRRKERFEEAADSAFILRVALSLIGILGAVVGGWVTAIIFSEPRLFLPTVVLSIGLLFQALSMVPRAIAARRLDYANATIPDHLGKFTGSFVTIGFALAGFAYWSPVWGTVLGLAVGTSAQLAVIRWRPRVRYNPPLAKEVVRFGQFVMLTSLGNFVAHSFDNAIVGYILGVTPLGLYAFAYSWGVYFTSNLSSVFGTVGYPIMSHVSDSPERLRRVLADNMRYFGYAGVGLSIGVFVLAPLMILSLYDARWHPAVLPVQLLSLTGLLLGYGGILGDAIFALGRPKAVFSVAWTEAGLLIVILPIATYFGGLPGTAIASIIGASAYVILLLNAIRKAVGFLSRTWLRVSKESIIAGVVAGTVGYVVSAFVSPSLPSFILVLGIFSALYVFTLQIATAGRFVRELREILSLAVS